MKMRNAMTELWVSKTFRTKISNIHRYKQTCPWTRFPVEYIDIDRQPTAHVCPLEASPGAGMKRWNYYVLDDNRDIIAYESK